MTHPLTDEMCEKIYPYVKSVFDSDDEHTGKAMRAAYDLGYAQALEDVQDIITCIQRKNSTPIPITLEELKDL